MSARCFHGSPVENCHDCTEESLRAEVARLKGELRDIGLALNDPRDNNTMTTAQCVADLRTQRAADTALLREVEWGKAPDDSMFCWVPRCLWCGQTYDKGHAPGCRLAARLEEADTK